MPYIWHLAPLDPSLQCSPGASPGGEGLFLAKVIHKVYEYGDSQTLNTEIPFKATTVRKKQGKNEPNTHTHTQTVKFQ